jgi:hypothetical protein
MSTTTADLPSDPDESPKLPEGLFENALAGPSDPRKNPALLELIRHMLPYAMTLIHAALDETRPRRGKAPTTGQIRELVAAQHVPQPDDDPDEEDPEVRAEIARRTREAIDRATEAALVSAAESFHGHGLKEFADVRGLNELALHLIRITYNRYQRRRRDDARLGRQTQSGRGSDAEGSFLESRPARYENPASQAEFREFLEIQRCLTDGALEGFSARDRRIVLLGEAGFEPDEIVALLKRLNKKQRPCTLNTVNHVVEAFRAQVHRIEEEEPDDEGQPSL